MSQAVVHVLPGWCKPRGAHATQSEHVWLVDVVPVALCHRAHDVPRASPEHFTAHPRRPCAICQRLLTQLHAKT